MPSPLVVLLLAAGAAVVLGSKKKATTPSLPSPPKPGTGTPPPVTTTPPAGDGGGGILYVPPTDTGDTSDPSADPFAFETPDYYAASTGDFSATLAPRLLAVQLATRGIPPTKYLEGGLPDQVAVLQDDVNFGVGLPAESTGTRDYNLPVLIAGIGPTARAGVDDPVARPIIARLFKRLSQRAENTGYYTGIDLKHFFDTPPTAANLESVYPQAAYLAAAAAGRYGMPYAEALRVVATDLASFLERHGIALSDLTTADGDVDTLGTNAFWHKYGGGIALAEAFEALQIAAANAGYQDKVTGAAAALPG